MNHSIAWYLAIACLTLLVSPLAIVSSQAGQADPADLYIIVDGGGSSLSQRNLISYGASEVGPFRGLLAKMIHAPPSSRTLLLQAGYVMVPASTLAAICGITKDRTTLTRKN
ncbi:hypothetical protein [Boseongicola aestuarii]|uniref:Uncharacterized protein n=1 Tax=Boseongicola aestuarii TaxID=1470561 RepID=A0A238J3Z9_9RHOB|nr:hypothetical protein [Boseongicola aestuarii]SMX25418.1 hypothetical protein BOA8489_03561 [Boseongicola aestuarii]